MPRSHQDRWRRQRGQSLLETAIMMIVIFMVVFWVIELGYFTYTYSVLTATTVTFPDGSAAPPNHVVVTVTYTYAPFLSSFMTTTTMKTYAEGRMVVP